MVERRRSTGASQPSPREFLTVSTRDSLNRLGSSEAGLSSVEADARLRLYGPNTVATGRRHPAAIEFLLQFRSPLTLILIFAALTTLYFGDATDAVIIFAIVIASASLDFYQQSRAHRAADLLRQRLVNTATVIRDGTKTEIRFTEVVPGDILLFSAGDMIPADSRIITAKDFFLNQAALTGESFPVEKETDPIPTPSVSLTDWKNTALTGSSVVSGTAMAIAISTGTSTEYGKISRTLAAGQPETEAERGLRRFGYLIMQFTLLLVVFVFAVNSLFRRGVLESLLFSVALAVGLTPELLPAIISINLSKGAMAMSRMGVLVKRLASIQNLGSMDILCTDKTGTLTENRIALILHVNIDGKDDDRVLKYSYLNSLNQTGLKSPLDEAVLAFKNLPDVGDYWKVDEIPFDFTRKRVSVVVRGEGAFILITKGAPEEVLAECSFADIGDTPEDLTGRLRKRVLDQFRALSEKGFRVLGVAYRRIREERPVYTVKDESDLVFLGFIAFVDPPKEGVKESLDLLRGVGVQLKILTGDNEVVTRHLCDGLGISIKRVVLGSEIAEMGDDALLRVAEEANIFARVNPAQKDRVMSALRRNGHVVGFLGDGINDAPSLRRSDVGISVENAVDVAKESADIILLEKDLTVLQRGVVEGRRTFGNTVKYILMGASSNFGNMFSVAGASLFLPFLPMLPTQILLNNLLYNLSQTSITTDNVDATYLARPRRMSVPFIRRFMLWFGPVSSIFDFLTFYVMLAIFSAGMNLFQTAWFLESLTTQTLVVLLIRTQITPFWKSRPSFPLVLTCVGIILFGFALPYSDLGRLFGFTPPPPALYPVLAVLVVAYLGLVELVKRVFYNLFAKLIG